MGDESKEVEFHLFTNQSQTFMSVLVELREQLGWLQEHENSVHTVSFVLCCAAALECSLNDGIISYFTLRSNSKETLVNGYLSMSLRGKLTNIIPLLTDGRFLINQEHTSFRTLRELITLRNRLVHNKSHFETFTATVIETEEEGMEFRIPKEVSQQIGDYTFGIKNGVGRFHDALEIFHEKFLSSYSREEFVGNELVVPSET